MKVVVTGIGLVSALGKNLEASWRNLLAGNSGIKVHQPFLELAPIPLGLIGEIPANLSALTQQVVAEALKDAGLMPPLLDCGVVIGSSRSHQAQWENLAIAHRLKSDLEVFSATSRQLIYPTCADVHHSLTQRTVGEGFTSFQCQAPYVDLKDWLKTLPNMAAITAAQEIGTNAAVLAPMAACATGIWAIAQGFELIQTGQCQRVIAGAVETPITPLTLTGFKQMGALAQTGAYPFDKYREGLVLGEAGAVLILESAELAESRKAKIYGELLGFGLTSDAYHTNTPEPESKSAIIAVKQCLERSKLSPAEIDYIHAHGTATQLNDKNEAHLIQYLFPQDVAVSSTKGATGHTLGASGALGIAFSLLALKYQILPPCVGLNNSEFGLNLVTKSRQISVEKVLCLSFGFGGQNAAIALQKTNY